LLCSPRLRLARWPSLLAVAKSRLKKPPRLLKKPLLPTLRLLLRKTLLLLPTLLRPKPPSKALRASDQKGWGRRVWTTAAPALFVCLLNS